MEQELDKFKWRTNKMINFDQIDKTLDKACEVLENESYEEWGTDIKNYIGWLRGIKDGQESRIKKLEYWEHMYSDRVQELLSENKRLKDKVNVFMGRNLNQAKMLEEIRELRNTTDLERENADYKQKNSFLCRKLKESETMLREIKAKLKELSQ